MTSRLFPALLRYWRQLRGVSQLDLALTTGVSARHVGFLESARARPSEAMALRLLAALDVPLRDQNEALRAAGYTARYAEGPPDALPPEVDAAVAQMMAQHEPYPLTVQTLDGAIVRHNRAAAALFGAFVAEPAALPAALDMFTLLFDPRLLRPFVVGWDALARGMLVRLQREALQRGADDRLTARLDRVLAMPGVPRGWRQPDFAAPVSPALTVALARDALRVRFVVTVTAFSAPQQVGVDELRIESCFPADDETRAACARLAAG